MDFLRLPASLRRTLISHVHTIRSYATSNAATSKDAATTPSTNAPPENLLTLTPSTLNSYTIFNPPDPTDLTTARSFFMKNPPEVLYSSPFFRLLPPSPFPEVAFLGRSNVGKSSLLNALFGRSNQSIARTSKRPGKTRTINGFGIGGEGLIGKQAAKPARAADGSLKSAKEEVWKRFGKGGLVVVDMPGYGGGSREEWGAEIMKYLQGRKQLRRTYVLIDTEHGLKKTDLQLLLHLRKAGIAHQVVLSKVDKLLYPHAKAPGKLSLHNGLTKLRGICEGLRGRLDEAAREHGSNRGMGVGDVLCCSSEKGLDENSKSRRIGVDELRWSVLTACGLESTGTAKREHVKIQCSEQAEDKVQEKAQFAPM